VCFHRRALMLGIIRRPPQFMAKIFEAGYLTYKFGTNGPKFFSPEFSIVPSAARKLSKNCTENSDKSAS
jgi:hypothetical protein